MIRTDNLLRKLFENPRNIVLVTDEQYNIRYASSAVETIFGIKPSSVVGRPGFDFVPESKGDEWRECLLRTIGNQSGEITLFTCSGDEVHFDVTVTSRVDHGDIHGMVVFMYNITDRRLLQKKLETENHHLDHVIFRTTHDLRAPLRSALGLIQLAELEPHEYLKYLALIKSSLDGLVGMIDEMNSFYRNEKLAIQSDRIDIRQLIDHE